MKPIVLGICLATAAFLSAEEPAAKADSPKPEQIAAWIRNLGSDEFAVREEAEKKLRSTNDEAVKPLKAAAEKSDSREFQTRVKMVIEYLTVGKKCDEAIKALGSSDWKTVKAGLDVLMPELGKNTKVDAKIRDAAKRNGPDGKIAETLRRELYILSSTQRSIDGAKERASQNKNEAIAKEYENQIRLLNDVREKIKKKIYEGVQDIVEGSANSGTSSKSETPTPVEKE